MFLDYTGQVMIKESKLPTPTCGNVIKPSQIFLSEVVGIENVSGLKSESDIRWNDFCTELQPL